MQGYIKKTAKNIENFRRKSIFYKSARQGFSEILKCLKNKYNNYTLLLPAYIGYSPNEGSGIYDPIIENKINHKFYAIDKNINVNIEDYKNKILKTTGKIVVLLVHYFGYVDPNIDEIVEFARKNNAIIIEDCAHALYTDYIDGICGNYSDVSIYSLHKMLPYQDGGMVRINNKETINLKETNYYYNILEYDLKKIAEKRKKNASFLEKKLKDLKGITILRESNYYKNQTPQTYPILILEADKNKFYHQLNNNGFGVVSLYHTMIKDLQKEEYKIANDLGSKILNLPVHQDTEEEELNKMCEEIRKILGEKDGRE